MNSNKTDCKPDASAPVALTVGNIAELCQLGEAALSSVQYADDTRIRLCAHTHSSAARSFIRGMLDLLRDARMAEPFPAASHCADCHTPLETEKEGKDGLCAGCSCLPSLPGEPAAEDDRSTRMPCKSCRRLPKD